MKRIERERRVVRQMIKSYCAAHHSPNHLCNQCLELQQYAEKRLGHCPYGVRKTACKKCPTHCYRPEMRQKIQAVMRYAGPRMIIHNPWAAIRHLLSR